MVLVLVAVLVWAINSVVYFASQLTMTFLLLDVARSC